MGFAGMRGGEVRAPLLPVDAEARSEIERLLDQLGHS